MVQQGVIALTLLSILLTQFLSAIVVLNPAHYQGNGNWLTGEKVLICTSEGLKWVAVSELRIQNSQEATANETPHALKFHCPILKLPPVLEHAPLAAGFFLLALLFCFYPVRLFNCNRVLERIYFNYAPKHSPPVRHHHHLMV
ncbi:hypothetical protein [Photobacterium atrarenae]|uniref:DUF2946 domain-containing protein n=1 Tax=Photobacterium atrarenae TaxID=865757 RepID=A0ABY5GMZ8_9GAMM|nr:hypothetical protein [Photobacterium atrarenae]UTV30665.1 hypothetical protein NNL38_19065 [Photobacterium atrarenae]